MDHYHLCPDCTQIAVNGDATVLDYYYSPDEAAQRLRDIEAGLDALPPIAYTGEYDTFSRISCDCCGTPLAGERHIFAAIE